MAPTTSSAGTTPAATPPRTLSPCMQQRQRTEAEQQGGGGQGGTTSGGRLPRAELVLDHVGHGLDDVVVDARRLVVDAGGHGEHAAVLDALDRQAGVVGQLAAVLGDEPVAAVDGGRVEEADAAGELGDQLGDGHGGRQHEIDAPRAGCDRDLDQTGSARGRLTHRVYPPFSCCPSRTDGPRRAAAYLPGRGARGRRRTSRWSMPAPNGRGRSPVRVTGLDRDVWFRRSGWRRAGRRTCTRRSTWRQRCRRPAGAGSSRRWPGPTSAWRRRRTPSPNRSSRRGAA